MNTGIEGPAYDRQLLLVGAKRNAVLDLAEVQQYGITQVPLQEAALGKGQCARARDDEVVERCYGGRAESFLVPGAGLEPAWQG